MRDEGAWKELLGAAVPRVDNGDEVFYGWQPVDLIVKVLLRAILSWIQTHPHSGFSRFMLRPRGPRTDVANMDRIQRLASAIVFLFWGALILGLWFLVGYLTFGLHLLSPDNPVVAVLMFALALLAGCGLLGGIYLLIRLIK